MRYGRTKAAGPISNSSASVAVLRTVAASHANYRSHAEADANRVVGDGGMIGDCERDQERIVNQRVARHKGFAKATCLATKAWPT